MTKSIKEQIKEKPQFHAALFACWGLSVCALISGKDPFAPLSVGFLITAMIDAKEK